MTSTAYATTVDRLKAAFQVRNAGVSYALVLTVLVLLVMTAVLGQPSYLNATNISNLLDQTALVALLAVFTTVVLISGNFDLSIASVTALSAVVSIMTVDALGLVGSVLVTLGVCSAIGLINGVMIQKVGVNAFIATLGTLTAVRGLVLVITDGQTRAPGSDVLSVLQSWSITIGDLFAGLALAGFAVLVALGFAWRKGHVGWAVTGIVVGIETLFVGLALRTDYTLLLTARVVYAGLLTFLIALITRFTVVGRRLYAVGGNPEASRLAGINVNGYRISALTLNGLASGFAGLLFASRIGAVNPQALTGLELTVLAAAILGGTSLFGGAGSVVKSVIGALLLFTLNNGFNILNLGANFQDLVQGIVILTAAAVYVMGNKRERKVAVADEASPNAQNERWEPADARPV